MAGDGDRDAENEMAPPVRPVAVVDANVLIPPGLRDLLLSCAEAMVFRPVWQAQIENEVIRNATRLAAERHGIDYEEAEVSARSTVAQMRRAFPDACVDTELWAPLVGQMTCDEKDRHVLAVAVGAGATHLVTANTRDFPVRSRPAHVAVVKPDRFLRDRLAEKPDLVISAVETLCGRLKRPPHTPIELAQLLTKGQFTPKFGTELVEVFENR